VSGPRPGREGADRDRPDREGTTRPRPDPLTRTGVAGVANTRTRLVGEREGVIADAVVSAVRLGTGIGRAAAFLFARLAAVITPLGWVMLGVIPFAFGVGYGLGWIELVVVGWAGVVLAVVAALYLIGRAPFRVELGLVHKRVVVGEGATGVVRLSNPGRRRTAGVTVEIPVGAGLAEIAMPALPGGGALAHEFAVPTTRRGLIPIGPVRTVRADPIGLVRRELVWTDRAELVVHPRTIPVPSTSTGLIRDLEGTPTTDLTSSDVSFHSLREFQTGDERRFIHWKSTAKAGTWMVRQFEQTRRSHLVVALSLSAADYATGEEFELAVSVAGSLGVRAIRDGRTVSVVVSALTPEYARRKTLAVRGLRTHLPAPLLDDLALVDPVQNAIGIRDVARVAAEDVDGISVAFLVCGSTPTPQSLRAASHSFPVDVGVVAIVCDPDGVPGLRRVAGLSVLTIGYLDDLRIALQRTAAVA
jgi:uncharacterized protein (DUF58 family)